MSDNPITPADPELLRFGLSRAIQIDSENFRVQCPQIRLDLDLIEDENLLPAEACLAFYQVYQLSLNHAARLQGERAVWVRYYPSPRGMVLMIKGEGKGAGGTLDLTALQARFEALGGQIKADFQAGQEMVITATIPFK